MERKRGGEKPRTKGKGRRRFAKRDKKKTRNIPLFFSLVLFELPDMNMSFIWTTKLGNPDAGKRK